MKAIVAMLASFSMVVSLSADGIPLYTNVRTRIPDDDWRHIAGRYGLVMTLFSPTGGGKDISGENERVKWIKSLNPDLKMLAYGSAINAANAGLRTWRKPQKHPEWFLKNEAGEWVTDWEYHGSLHLDPGNAEWQEFMAKAYADYDARYRYITASFLLGMGERHYLCFYAKVRGKPECYLPGEEVLPAFCNVSLGQPRGVYQQTDGVYQRDFERGKALVNPTGRERRVPLSGNWKTAEGQAVFSPLLMPAPTGAILVRE